jgi:hypothetical protein
VRVGAIASGRAGDKGATLDLSVVAVDAAGYALLTRALTVATVARQFGVTRVDRYELPGLLALKFVVPEILGDGVYASLRAGVHWQKAAISVLLDLDFDQGDA